ncbi:hypothetical protein AXG93_2587s1730 [Marchantia polymorpha subsp. ruderalis]|uniref:Uncharacterized protein n=1 Tax=Marchantia polymorpha subsp. ruderalis TaxID=1480154 RepID=A0A176WQR9_MARPO|nr:hypothetical protein AXG93_2587s1730 [Marchantia polymorpha subsp. ruderalis]
MAVVAMEVDPDTLLFTQDSIAVRFKKPYEKEKIDDAVISILNGAESSYRRGDAKPGAQDETFKDRLLATAELPVIRRPESFADDGQNRTNWPVTHEPDENNHESERKKAVTLVIISSALTIAALALASDESRRSIVNSLSSAMKVTFLDIIPALGRWTVRKFWQTLPRVPPPFVA